MEKIIDLDWGSITPEFYNGDKKIIVHIFNHNLVGEENLSRAIRFSIGRIEWFGKMFFPDFVHEIVFDDRGQNIDENVRGIILKNLSKQASKVSFISELR